jgi:hypothetical protein
MTAAMLSEIHTLFICSVQICNPVPGACRCADQQLKFCRCRYQKRCRGQQRLTLPTWQQQAAIYLQEQQLVAAQQELAFRVSLRTCSS